MEDLWDGSWLCMSGPGGGITLTSGSVQPLTVTSSAPHANRASPVSGPGKGDLSTRTYMPSLGLVTGGKDG
jgi:hypothetical protein